MQVDLLGAGTFLFTSDQFQVKENYTKRQPQGTHMMMSESALQLT